MTDNRSVSRDRCLCLRTHAARSSQQEKRYWGDAVPTQCVLCTQRALRGWEPVESGGCCSHSHSSQELFRCHSMTDNRSVPRDRCVCLRTHAVRSSQQEKRYWGDAVPTQCALCTQRALRGWEPAKPGGCCGHSHSWY